MIMPADTTTKGGFGLNEIHVGGSLKELAHLGLSFGNRNAFTVYGGVWEGLWSTGVSIKRYRLTPDAAHTLSKKFTRFASGVLVEPGDEGTDFFTGAYYSNPAHLELLYFSVTWGKDFYFDEKSGLGVSLEGGLMLLPDLGPRTISNELFPLLPTASVKFFYKIKRRVKTAGGA